MQERGIPRATADRLAKRYAETLVTTSNCVNDAISEASEEAVQKLFVALWPKLRRILTTGESVYYFVSALASACAGLGFQIGEDGIFIPKPGAESTTQQPNEATAIADTDPKVAMAEADAKPATAALLVDDPRFADQASAETGDHAETASV